MEEFWYHSDRPQSSLIYAQRKDNIRINNVGIP